MNLMSARQQGHSVFVCLFVCLSQLGSLTWILWLLALSPGLMCMSGPKLDLGRLSTKTQLSLNAMSATFHVHKKSEIRYDRFWRFNSKPATLQVSVFCGQGHMGLRSARQGLIILLPVGHDHTSVTHVSPLSFDLVTQVSVCEIGRHRCPVCVCLRNSLLNKFPVFRQHDLWP